MLEGEGCLIKLPRELINYFELQQRKFLPSGLEERLHGVFGEFAASGFTLHRQHQCHTGLQVLEVHILHLKQCRKSLKCVRVRTLSLDLLADGCVWGLLVCHTNCWTCQGWTAFRLNGTKDLRDSPQRVHRSCRCTIKPTNHMAPPPSPSSQL